jgi:hypothetical protein
VQRSVSLEHDGYALAQQIWSADECTLAASQIALQDTARGGSRTLLAQPWCAALAAQLRRHPLLRAHMPPDSVAVQCTYFEKSEERNWLVPVHQDLSIPVAGKVDEETLRGWSEKEGMLYVQAPAEVLSQLLAVRLHLDHCGVQDGPLRVIPGSHQAGILAADEVQRWRDVGSEVACLAGKGDALLLRPLLLHASSKGRGESRRRVLHFVFGPPMLPLGLRWPATVLACARTVLW